MILANGCNITKSEKFKGVWILSVPTVFLSSFEKKLRFLMKTFQDLYHCLAMTAAVWKPCPTMFLHNFGHRRMGIKYSLERFIIYQIINTVGNSKRGFTEHNASGRSLILRSVITIADDNMQDQHCSCITGYDWINLHLTSLIWRGTEM